MAAIALVVGVGVVAGSHIVMEQRRADRARQAQVELARVSHFADGVRFAPIGFVHGLPATAKDVADIAGYSAEAARDAQRLVDLYPAAAPVRNAIERLNAAVAHQLALVQRQQLGEAQAWDTQGVAPAYEQLASLFPRFDTVLARRANDSRATAERDVMRVLVVAGGLLFLVAAGWGAASRRRVRLAARRQALQASEERFRALVQNGSDMITVVAPDSTVLYQALSVRRVLGYDAAVLEGAALVDWVHPDDLDKVLAVCGMVGTGACQVFCVGSSWLVG